MAKIKDDLVGVVYAYTNEGKLHKLRAGDTVPSGVKVRDELCAPTPKQGGTRAKSRAADSND